MSIAPNDAKPDETFEIYVKAYLAWGELQRKMKNDKKKLIEFTRGYDLTPRMSKKAEDYDDAESLWKSIDVHLTTVYNFLNPTLDELKPYMLMTYTGQGYIPLPAPSVQVAPEEEPAPEVIEKRPVRVTRSKSKKVAL